jgi:hypothetical protein
VILYGDVASNTWREFNRVLKTLARDRRIDYVFRHFNKVVYWILCIIMCLLFSNPPAIVQLDVLLVQHRYACRAMALNWRSRAPSTRHRMILRSRVSLVCCLGK